MPDAARVVIDTHIINPRLLSEAASYDAASNTCQAM
jgi:hypothetical protein